MNLKASVVLGCLFPLYVAGGLLGSALDELPPAVRHAAEGYLQGATPSGWEREQRAGGLLYEIAWVANGREHELVLTERGELVEQEEVVPAEEVPAAVRTAAAAQLGASGVVYERKQVVLYEASVVANGREREVLLDSLGQPASETDDEVDDDADDDDGDDGDDGDGDGDDDEEREVPVRLSDVPAAVLAAANAAVPGASWSSALIEGEGEGLVYELSGTVAGASVEVKVAADGRVIEVDRG